MRVALLLHHLAAKSHKGVRDAAAVRQMLVGRIDGAVDAALHHVAVQRADSRAHAHANVAVFVRHDAQVRRCRCRRRTDGEQKNQENRGRHCRSETTLTFFSEKKKKEIYLRDIRLFI
jgi:hypothetical protein